MVNLNFADAQKISTKTTEEKFLCGFLMAGLRTVKVHRTYTVNGIKKRKDNQTLQDFTEWETNFVAVPYDVEKDKKYELAIRKESLIREDETDPLMNIWLPPLGHSCKCTSWRENENE